MKIEIKPRTLNDKGGYLCMPLKRNVPEGHKGWKLVKCPQCEAECWKRPLLKELKNTGITMLCTECALKIGI